MLPRPVIVYDGQCPYCLRQITRIQSRDRHHLFEYLPRQTEGIESRFPILTQGDFNTGMRLIHPDGSVSVGADAIYQIARQLPGYRALAWLYRVPILKQLFRAAYAWVAKNRYRLAPQCDTQACPARPSATANPHDTRA